MNWDLGMDLKHFWMQKFNADDIQQRFSKIMKLLKFDRLKAKIVRCEKAVDLMTMTPVSRNPYADSMITKLTFLIWEYSGANCRTRTCFDLL